MAIEPPPDGWPNPAGWELNDYGVPMEPGDPWASMRRQPRKHILTEGQRSKKGLSPHKAAEARRAQVLRLMENGRTIGEALDEMGLTRAAYRAWRKRFPDFAARADAVRSGTLAATVGQWNGDFTSFRKVYLGYDTFFHQQKIVQAVEHAPAQSVTMVLVPPEHGKLLADDTPVPTPDGWTTMGEIQVGSTVFAATGEPTTVVGVYPDTNPELYRLTFADGGTIDACRDHRFLVRGRDWSAGQSRKHYAQRVVTVAEMIPQLYRRGRPMLSIPVTGALDLPERDDLAVDPYTLGAWLGDGHTQAGMITCPDDPEIVEACAYQATPASVRHGRVWSWRLAGLSTDLRAAGVFANKHIPAAYLRASIKQRLALLQGLMDTDGSCSTRGQCEFTTTNERLARDVAELIWSLGHRCRVYEGRATLNGQDYGPKWRISFYPDEAVFRLDRKASRQNLTSRQGDRMAWRIITAIEPIASRPGRCITVAHPSHLFLAGSSFVVSHNTTVIEDWITFKLATAPNTRITIVSEGQPHARKIMRRVQARLSNPNSKLWADFGPFYEAGQERRGKPWGSDFFTVLKAEHDERDYSLECRGWRSAIAGTRTDFLIIDDVTSKRNHNQAESIVETLRQDFFTRPGKDGHTIIVGTRVDTKDVYERLLDATDDLGNPLVTEAVVLPAENERGEPLCPEMWPKEALARKRAIVGESVWWRNYQQKPKAAGDLTFSDPVMKKGANPFAPIGTKVATSPWCLIGLDPAVGGGNAFVVWSYDAERMRIIDYQRDFGLARTEDILVRLERLAARYQPQDVVVEAMAFQRALANDARLQEMADRFGFRVSPHLTGSGGYSKLDEDLGVAQMATDMSRGILEYCWAPDAREHMGHLVAEFQAWRPGMSGKQLRQDIVMAAWFGWILMTQRRRAMATHVPATQWTTRKLPYAPTAYKPGVKV